MYFFLDSHGAGMYTVAIAQRKCSLSASLLRAKKAIEDYLYRGNPWKNSGGDTFHGTQWKNHSKSGSQVKFSEFLKGFNGLDLIYVT